MSTYIDDSPEIELPKPMVHLNVEHFPVIEGWEVGRKYTVLVELKQVSRNENDDGYIDAGFEITKLKELPKTKGEFSKDDVKVALSMNNLEYLR